MSTRATSQLELQFGIYINLNPTSCWKNSICRAGWTPDNTICKRRNSLIVTSWKKLTENRIAGDKSVSGGTNLISKHFLIKSCWQVVLFFFSLGECLVCYHDANVVLNVRLHWANVNAKAMSLPDGLLFTKTKENFTFAFPFAQCKWTLNKK